MKRWERATPVLKLQEAEAELAKHEPGSHRHVAEQVGIPRSTLQYWQQRQEALEATPQAGFRRGPSQQATGGRQRSLLILPAHKHPGWEIGAENVL